MKTSLLYRKSLIKSLILLLLFMTIVVSLIYPVSQGRAVEISIYKGRADDLSLYVFTDGTFNLNTACNDALGAANHLENAFGIEVGVYKMTPVFDSSPYCNYWLWQWWLDMGESLNGFIPFANEKVSLSDTTSTRKKAICMTSAGDWGGMAYPSGSHAMIADRVYRQPIYVPMNRGWMILHELGHTFGINICNQCADWNCWMSYPSRIFPFTPTQYCNVCKTKIQNYFK